MAQITKELEAIVDATQLAMQQALKIKLGILVDIPKQGYGSTNDGNTARKFFANIDQVAEITGT